MATLDIRTARDEDLPVLVAAFGQSQYFADRLARQRRGVGELLIAWRDGRPVGNGCLWREEPYEEAVRRHLGHIPTLTHLEVLPAEQGQGIGTQLIGAAERIATDLGYWQISLGVGVDNPAARRLYERIGYREWPHGSVDVIWDQVDEHGFSERHDLRCHWLVKQLPTDFPHVDKWQAWSPGEAATRLRDLGLTDVPWYVAGGWAVDLHLGKQTREHEDLEIAIPRTRFGRWRTALSAYRLYDAGAGRLRALGPTDQPDPVNHQVWLRDDDVWRLDTFLESGDETTWVSHRDARIRVPWADAVTTNPDGIAYLRPQYVLLGKAKHQRPKDVADFESLLPTMDVAARRWLAGALSTVHPGHTWIWPTIKG